VGRSVTELRCVKMRRDGKPCTNRPVHGATVCRPHGGTASQILKKAIVRYEISQWKLGDSEDDPGITLLRMITQSRRRADLYSSLLEEAYKAAEIEALIGTGLSWHMPAGVSALIGHKYALDAQGTPVPVSEAIRGLVELESQERDRCVNFCVKAIAAGLAERVVRMQERDASLAHQALIAGLDEAGIVGEQRAVVLNGAVRHLRLVPSL